MKQTLEGVLKYLRKNYCSYWIILGIDTAIAVLCTCRPERTGGSSEPFYSEPLYGDAW